MYYTDWRSVTGRGVLAQIPGELRQHPDSRPESIERKSDGEAIRPTTLRKEVAKCALRRCAHFPGWHCCCPPCSRRPRRNKASQSPATNCCAPSPSQEVSRETTSAGSIPRTHGTTLPIV